MWRKPALLDTDIGDDIDDAFALALALRLPQLSVQGVTTVAGPVERRARLAQAIVNAAGQPGIPIAPGRSTMRDGRAGSAKFSHQPVLDRAECRVPIANDAAQSAIDLIVSLSHSASPLTIIALGPLTNIAAALDRDPALAQRARLVAMAGKLGLPYPDWNLRCDPAAARRVLGSGIPITLVGMHVTMRAKMRAGQIERVFGASDELGQALARCVVAWRTWRRRIPILHDALAVAIAADPTLAQLERRQVRVGWRGFSRATRGGTPNALVCTDVDIARYNSLLERHLFGGPAERTERCGAWRRLIQLIA